MNARILTFPPHAAYASAVAGKQPATGGESPNNTAAKAVTALHDGFFASGVSSMGGRTEGAFGLAGCRMPVSQPPSRSPTPFESGAGGSKPHTEVIMTSIAQSASSPAVFDFQSHQVRIVTRNGEPWFVASDVCNALGYSNTSKAVGDHLDADERASEMVPTPNAPLGVPTNIISESGLYALVLRSRKPEARKFAKWVTSEVLPAIRKTGAYSATASDMVSKAHVLRCFAMTSALTGPAQTAVMNQLLDHNEHDVQYGRFLVTFCDETPFVKAVPNDAAVMTQAQFLRALTEGNAVPVSTQDLAQFIEAATKRLAQRCAFYEGKAGRRAA